MCTDFVDEEQIVREVGTIRVETCFFKLSLCPSFELHRSYRISWLNVLE
jgi:hypothetical protein